MILGRCNHWGDQITPKKVGQFFRLMCHIVLFHQFLRSLNGNVGVKRVRVYMRVKHLSTCLPFSFKCVKILSQTILLLLFCFFHFMMIVGMLPRSQVKPEMVASYVSQERRKRRKLFQKFLDTCSASKVTDLYQIFIAIVVYIGLTREVNSSFISYFL
jgi:hypothetical protein